MDDKKLNLGVLFTGDISPTLKKAVTDLNQLVANLNTVLGKISKAGGTKALAALAKQANVAGKSVSETTKDLTAYSAAMGKAETNGRRFSETLSSLSKSYKNNGLKIKNTEQAMYKADKVIRQLTREVGNQASTFATASNAINTTSEKVGIAQQKWSAFKKAVNLTTITQKGLTGEIALSKKGISDYITKVSKGVVTFDKFTTSTKKSWPIINQINKAIDSGNMSWQEAAKMQASYQAVTSKTTASQNKLTQETEKFTKASKSATPNINAMNKAIDNGTMSWQEASRVQSTYRSVLDKTLPSQKAAVAALKASKDATNAFTEATKRAVPNTAKMNKEYDAGTRSLSSMVKEQATYRSALNGTLPSQQAAAAALKASKDATNAFT